MPFVPLDEGELPGCGRCRSPEHNPPGHIVITEPRQWVCPACGESQVLYPTNYSGRRLSNRRWCGEPNSYGVECVTKESRSCGV